MAESSRTASDAPAPPLLRDPWRRPVPLDGLLERGQFSPIQKAVLMAVLAFFMLVSAFLAFNIAGSLFAVLLYQMQGVSLDQFLSDPIGVQGTYVRETLAANTLGQILGLGLFALIAVRLHSSRPWAFLRLDRANLVLIVLALVGLAPLMPVIGWLGELNQLLPVPDWVQQLEDMRMEMIGRALESNLSVAFIVSMLAITPALCEELLFRGYAQRLFERSLGVAGGIAVTGLTFGAYHLSALQIVPLSVLGIYLAWLTWRTGSLWPAIAVHFANNAYAAVSAQVAAREQGVPLVEVETMDLPWYIVVAALVVFAGVVAGLRHVARAAQPAADAPMAETPAGDASPPSAS